MWWRDPVEPPPLPPVRGLATDTWGVLCPRCGHGTHSGIATRNAIELECARCRFHFEVPAGAYPRAAERRVDGHVLVPIDATPAMVAAAGPAFAQFDMRSVWDRMVRAAVRERAGDGVTP